MKKRSRRFKILISFVLIFAAWIFLAPFFAWLLIVEKSVENADAIVVLGGSAVYEERAEKAAAAYQNKIAPKIVLTDDGERSGWSRTERRNIPYVELAQRKLIQLGVPTEHIETVKPAGSGTIYEAQTIRERAERENWRAVLIVTSAYHTRRALETFDGVFADSTIEIGIVGAPVGRQTAAPVFWWLSPRGWRDVAGEYVKSFYYWLYY